MQGFCTPNTPNCTPPQPRPAPTRVSLLIQVKKGHPTAATRRPGRGARRGTPAFGEGLPGSHPRNQPHPDPPSKYLSSTTTHQTSRRTPRGTPITLPYLGRVRLQIHRAPKKTNGVRTTSPTICAPVSPVDTNAHPTPNRTRPPTRFRRSSTLSSSRESPLLYTLPSLGRLSANRVTSRNTRPRHVRRVGLPYGPEKLTVMTARWPLKLSPQTTPEPSITSLTF